jgi:hypothetical protein
MKKLTDYVRSIPIRLALAAIVFGLATLAINISGKVPEKKPAAAEEPAPGNSGGIASAHQESTEAALRFMASRPADPEKK